MTLLGTPWSGKLDLSDPASGPLLESWLLAIQGILDGNIDFNNVNSSGNIPLTALATGTWQHNAGSSVKRKIMRGKKSVTLSGTPGAGTATVTFGTPSGGDHDDPTGATAFKSATVPVVVLTCVQGSSSTARFLASIDAAPTNTTLTIRVQTADNAASSATVTVHWMAIGETD